MSTTTTWKPTRDEVARALETLVQAVELAVTCEGSSHISDTLARRDVRRALNNARAHLDALAASQ